LIEKSQMKLSLYDLSGKFIKDIINDNNQSLGEHNYTLSTKNLSSSEYMIIFSTETFQQTERITIVR